MISFTSAQLSTWLATLIFPLARILALIASSPIYGIKEVPARIKVGFALAITLVIAPTLDIPPALDPASALGLFVLMQQIVAGVIIGFSIRLIFAAVEMAGDIAGMQMGLGFASFYDPQNATFTPVIAQFLGIIASLVFLAADGHLYMLSTLWPTVSAISRSERKFPRPMLSARWQNGAVRCSATRCNSLCR